MAWTELGAGSFNIAYLNRDEGRVFKKVITHIGVIRGELAELEGILKEARDELKEALEAIEEAKETEETDTEETDIEDIRQEIEETKRSILETKSKLKKVIQIRLGELDDLLEYGDLDSSTKAIFKKELEALHTELTTDFNGIKADETLVLDREALLDEPERVVEIWNQVNGDIGLAKLFDHPELGKGWTAPFIEGRQATDKEICKEAISIFNRSGRIVLDGPGENNFITIDPLEQTIKDCIKLIKKNALSPSYQRQVISPLSRAISKATSFDELIQSIDDIESHKENMTPDVMDQEGHTKLIADLTEIALTAAQQTYTESSPIKTICIDLGLALQTCKTDEIDNDLCLEEWQKRKADYQIDCKGYERFYPKTIYINKALLFIQENFPEITNVDFLLDDNAFISKLAEAYDRQIEALQEDELKSLGDKWIYPGEKIPFIEEEVINQLNIIQNFQSMTEPQETTAPELALGEEIDLLKQTIEDCIKLIKKNALSPSYHRQVIYPLSIAIKNATSFDELIQSIDDIESHKENMTLGVMDHEGHTKLMADLTEIALSAQQTDMDDTPSLPSQ